MAASTRNIGRSEWEGRHRNETQCDADGDLPRESPTPNLHFILQFHQTTGICSRGVSSANSNRVSGHLVLFADSGYNFGALTFCIRRCWCWTLPSWNAPRTSAQCSSTKTSHEDGSGQGRQSTLASSRLRSACTCAYARDMRFFAILDLAAAAIEARQHWWWLHLLCSAAVRQILSKVR